MPPPFQKTLTHLVLIPSYNTGSQLVATVLQARKHWPIVWVVIDGSTDDSKAQLHQAKIRHDGIRILCLPRNQGKGAAVLYGLQQALREGYTHILTMDADGQHPAGCIAEFMNASRLHPECMILGKPVFASDAPALRVWGRKVSNAWANIETLGGIGDSLYGFRVYPAAPLEKIMRNQRFMRRFDFDPEAVVRMRWAGVPGVNREAPVRYLRPEEGGVSHFKYLRDNFLLTGMHLRLLAEFLLRFPWLLWRKVFRPL